METAQSMLMRTLIGEAVDEARVGVVVYDDNGRYIAANRAMCEVLGYTLDELLALSPVDVSARAAKAVAKGLAALVANGTASGTARLRRKDGAVVAGRYVAAPTTIARLDYYVSIFEPAGRSQR